MTRCAKLKLPTACWNFTHSWESVRRWWRWEGGCCWSLRLVVSSTVSSAEYVEAGRRLLLELEGSPLAYQSLPSPSTPLPSPSPFTTHPSPHPLPKTTPPSQDHPSVPNTHQVWLSPSRLSFLIWQVWLSPSRRGPSYRLALLSDSVLLASPRSPPITSATAYFRRSSARTLRIKSHAPLTSASLVPPPPPTHAGTAPLCNTLVLVLDCERYELFTRSTTAAQHALEVFSRALVSNAVASSAVGSGASTIESPTASSPASRGACALDSSVAATLQPSHTSKREGVQREGNDGRVQSPSSTALTKGNLQLPPMEHALEQNLTGFDVD